MVGKPVGKGDIVLFNNPSPRSLQTMVGNRELFISRCVGIPGDTLMLNEELLLTDEHVLSPTASLFMYIRIRQKILCCWLCSNWVLQEISW